MDKYDLKKAVQNIADKLATHVGAGDGEHLPVDRQHAGFMTPEQYLGLFNAKGFRDNLPAGTDVMALPPGHYVGTNLVNSKFGKDDGTVLMIDVYQYRDASKQIFEITGSNGEIYYYNKYVGGNGDVNKYSPTGWAKIERYIPLWEGSISDTTTRANFVDCADKYPYLRITTTNNIGSVKQTIVKNQQELIINDSYVTADQLSATIYALKLFVVGSYAQIENSHGVDIKGSGTSIHPSRNISLLKIEGVL